MGSAWPHHVFQGDPALPAKSPLLLHPGVLRSEDVLGNEHTTPLLTTSPYTGDMILSL